MEVDEISKLINESYQVQAPVGAPHETSIDSRDGSQKEGINCSVIYKDEKVFDYPKRAVYGIQPSAGKFE